MSIVIIAQTEQGRVKKASLEAISAGRRLSHELKSQLFVLLFENVDNAEALGGLGADRVIIAETDYSLEQYANIVAKLLGKDRSHIVLLASSIFGNDLACRIGAKVNGGVLVDCKDVFLTDSTLQVKKRIGNYIATLEFTSSIKVLTLIPNSQPIKIFKRRTCEVERLPPIGSVLKTFVKDIHRESPNRLKNAEIIVCGGYGLGDKINFKLIEALASVIKGEVGATRTAVDAGFAPKQVQVGASALKVNPLLYIGCGVSGSEDHLSGISNSKIIVAINKNKDAPIFEYADYCIVDDLTKFVPALVSQIEKERIRSEVRLNHSE